MADKDDGFEKGALLLVSLGADEAAEGLKHLGPKEVCLLYTSPSPRD